MKNYIIGTLAVIILVMASLFYRNNTAPVNKKFPAVMEAEKYDVEAPLFLYVFLSKNNCIDCMGFIEVLNSLPPQFVVSGVVPDGDLKNGKELREITGATFPLMSVKKLKKFIPWYTPSTIGVSPNGDIIFQLPGVPGEKLYIEKFLDSLYGKLYPIFLKEKLSGQ
jgi:hypothetical protein